MADALSLQVRGVKECMASLDALAALFPVETGKALRKEAEIEMTEAKRRTPVQTGTLRSSGVVEGPDPKSGEIEVRLAFGGPAAPYAVYVHENLEAFHKVGQAKFLESTLNESLPHLAQRVAKRMALNEKTKGIVKFKVGERPDEWGKGAGPLGGGRFEEATYVPDAPIVTGGSGGGGLL